MQEGLKQYIGTLVRDVVGLLYGVKEQDMGF